MAGFARHRADLASPLASRWIAGLLLVAGCAHAAPMARPDPRPSAAGTPGKSEPAAARPVIPAGEAWARGWMPLEATRVPAFAAEHPEADGRGVIIGILDSGLDPTIAGLESTTTGERKVLDLRDFSGEGRIVLTPVRPEGDRLPVPGGVLAGGSRLRALTTGEWWAGALVERTLGELPAADLNGDGDDADTLAVVVARATDGWVLFADTDGDGSLAGERPIHDFLTGRETFGWHRPGRPAPLALAVNLQEREGRPLLDLFFDTSAHGSHVAGIAAGHSLYGVAGFDGVAPGASLLGLKIADNARGGISTTGSMLAAIDYAIRFAAERGRPLVLNMSFGVGNEAEGEARIDALIDSVLGVHPELIFTISAGNDGPGLSTIGYPGSADRALTVGAVYPGVFLGARSGGNDPVAFFSSRGGELAKPDLVTPGMAYSTVPRWNVGDEQKGGTSMASPYAAGLAARLVSGLARAGRPIVARQVRQALMVTARPVPGATFLDDGTGVPDLDAAWRWLEGGREVPEIAVRARRHGITAGLRIRRPGDALDTIQAFDLTLPAGAPETEVTLRSSVPWLRAPASARLHGGANQVRLSYRGSDLERPGVYTGTVTGWTRDSLLGPVFRLVNTVVVADTAWNPAADLGTIPAGGSGRRFFPADSGRPFAVTFTTPDAREQVLAWLHEPGGQPYREQNGIGAGTGEQAGVYMVDGRDVVPGLYEAVAVAPPLVGARASIAVEQSPVTIRARTTPEGIAIMLGGAGSEPLTAAPFVVLVGAERSTRMAGDGSGPERLRFTLPPWAVHATVDVAMDRASWPRFTDFGVTLFDAHGRQLGKAPLNYAFGRFHVDLPPGAAGGPAVVELLPGFADSGGDQRWSARLSVRLYADSTHVVRLSGGEVTVAPGRVATSSVPWDGRFLPLGDGFVPLGIVVVPDEPRTWTREVALPVSPGHP